MKNVVGIDKKLHSGILKALQIVYGKDISIANLQDFGPAGIQDLAASVAVELAKGGKFSKKRPRRSIHFTIPHHRTEFDLVWKEGESLLDVANGVGGDLIGEYMEGTCGGQMSCCSCHIYLDQMTFDALPPACEAELDMLELAYEPAETSRLGCQVRLQKELLKAEHEITITIPADVNNVWN
jgi:ferredoxin